MATTATSTDSAREGTASSSRARSAGQAQRGGRQRTGSPATSGDTARAPRAGRRPPADKYDERRRELAESALKTLSELGYARTSLREIAANSEFSHGVVHYYFADKTDLILYCVRHYKAQCVTRYDGIVAEAQTADELRTGFADKLAETMVQEGPMHRLWYDLRAQSMFEGELRNDVAVIDDTLRQMIWRVIERYAALSKAATAVDADTAYGLLDGIFEQALLRHQRGEDDAPEALRRRAERILPMLVD